MQKILKSTSRWRTAAALALSATVLAACGGGASDVAGDDGRQRTRRPPSPWSRTRFRSQVGRRSPRRLRPPTRARASRSPSSYGASGDQSRSVESGKPADVVNFSVEPDITRLVKAGKVDEDWNAGPNKGIPFGSVCRLAVRQGNPKNIHDWDDLLQPGRRGHHPSPLSSGSAKWNLLAPYAAASNGGQNPPAGMDFVTKLVTEHVKTAPGLGPGGHRRFRQGSGDVLSATRTRRSTPSVRQGVEHVNPPQTFKIENPTAVVNSSPHLDKANAFVDFLFTPEGQKLWAEAGFRPVDPAVLPSSPTSSPPPRSCGPSQTWVAGTRSTRSCSTRRTARSPRSTSRPLDDNCARTEPRARSEASRPELTPETGRTAGRSGGTAAPPFRSGSRWCGCPHRSAAAWPRSCGSRPRAAGTLSSRR